MQSDRKTTTRSIDRGCTLHPTCTECTESKCRYDTFRGLPSLEKLKRNTEIFNEWKKGVSYEQLSRIFTLDISTVRKIVVKQLKLVVHPEPK